MLFAPQSFRSYVALLLLSPVSLAQVSKFEYSPERMEAGVAYHYVKSNVDGSRASNVALFVESAERIESFKWHEGASEATLVTAEIDWERFSVSLFESWKLRADGNHLKQATLKAVEGEPRVLISAGPMEAEAQIDHWPWHSYDFDFASLNVSLRHLRDPEGVFQMGISDFDRSVGEFRDKGPVEVAFVERETRCERPCRKYRIDGPGLEDRGGTLWAAVDGGYLVDYEIDLPDEPGFTDGKLQLVSIERLSTEQWREFKAAKLGAEGEAGLKR